MTILRKMLVGSAGLAALAAAAPSTAQYYGYSRAPTYGYGTYQAPAYGYGTYGRTYGGYGMNTAAATQQCTAAVNNRLYTRTGLGGIIGSLLGTYGSQPRVIGVTRVIPRGYETRVDGLASSGRSYGYQADLAFRCTVDTNGYVRNVHVSRRY